MNNLTGNAEYIDVLERSLYNGALDGLSLSGDRFFYGNPLASDGKHARKEWFGTACCPSNIARLIASLGDFIYGYSENKIYVNLFVGSQTEFNMPAGKVKFNMQTNYPWSGAIKCSLSMKKNTKTSIAFRIPGWSRGIAAPGNLYFFRDTSKEKPTLIVNGKAVEYSNEEGYAVIQREWKNDDVIEFNIPMKINQISARNELEIDNDRIAIQRGPIVYCIEGADNNGKAWNIISSFDAKFKTEDFIVLDEKVISIVADMPVLKISDDGLGATTSKQKVRAIPYYTWCNRGSNQMQVWLPLTFKDIKVNY
jgi:DUF1680 family protein